MIDSATILATLSQRGITTLEGFVATKTQMTKAVRVDAKAASKIFEQLTAPSGRSAKFERPVPTIPVVLDGKRIESDQIARFSDRPLDYVHTTLEGGEQALVVFTDRSVMRNHLQNDPVMDALTAAGLQPRSHVEARDELGVWIYEDINFEEDVKMLPPGFGVDDLTQFSEGREWLEGSWNDVISSIRCRGCYAYCTADVGWNGDTITFGPWEDVPNLVPLGWNDRISSIWARSP
jgi:hypothetical protein